MKEQLEKINKAKSIAQAHPLKSITFLDNHSRVSKNPTKVSIVFMNGDSFLFDTEIFQKHFQTVNFKLNITGKKFEDYKRK